MEGGMEGLKLEERSVSSSSIEPVGKGLLVWRGLLYFICLFILLLTILRFP